MEHSERYKIYIDILEMASVDFAKPPDPSRYNYDGLCHYLSYKILGQRWIIKEILGDMHGANTYTIAPNSQDYLWRNDSPGFYKRSEWCKQRIKYFKQKLEKENESK